jgi:hypothetical protein
MPPRPAARAPAPLALAALAALAAVAGCKALDEGAKEGFSHRYSCPQERVQVRRRADVRPYDVAFGRLGPATPPDEVAADPGRKALWEKDEREKRRRWNSSFEVYEVRGCGHQVIQTCAHPVDLDGGTLVGQVDCTEGEYPAGAQKPW